MAKVVICGEVFLAKEEGSVGRGFPCLFQYGGSGVQPRYCVCVCLCVCVCVCVCVCGCVRVCVCV